MHKINSKQDNPSFAQLVELSIQNAEQLQEVKTRQDIILAKLNEQYLKEQEQEPPKKYYRPLTPTEKQELDFNPLAYLEHKGLLALSEYDSDRNFIQEVIENYTRLGLVEYKTCIHNIKIRIQDTRKAPIGNMRAYIKSSLNKHNAKK